MPKNKGIYKLFRTKQELEVHENIIRRFERRFVLDHVTLALGRMGWREKKFREFDKALTEVYDEYTKEYIEDMEADKEMVYSRAVLDRELKQYVGSMFVPMSERYDLR